MLKPSAAVATTVPFSSSLLRDFVNRYEERRRLRSEIESMEDQIKKGKLSRRKFRLRKSSVDDHISRLEKDLSQLSNKISAASEQYMERMKHLKKAEDEIETLKNDIERAEARFLRKEITAEARRKMLDEYNRMKERAENTIEETLLRLKEETH
jgi:chromosome segregation ATPase